MIFNGYCVITQGNPLSPTIFNVVLDTVIRYWVAVVVPIKDVTEELGLSIQDLARYFYANNVPIASTQLERLQRAFDVLSGLSDWFCLRTNARKTVSMDW